MVCCSGSGSAGEESPALLGLFLDIDQWTLEAGPRRDAADLRTAASKLGKRMHLAIANAASKLPALSDPTLGRQLRQSLPPWRPLPKGRLDSLGVNAVGVESHLLRQLLCRQLLHYLLRNLLSHLLSNQLSLDLRLNWILLQRILYDRVLQKLVLQKCMNQRILHSGCE